MNDERKVRPITPEEITTEKKEQVPDIVITTINELIVQKFNNGSSCILQKDIMALLTERGLKSNEVFEKGWLNIEGLYRDFGWKVEYDKPAYNETYEASFKFTPLKK